MPVVLFGPTSNRLLMRQSSFDVEWRPMGLTYVDGIVRAPRARTEKRRVRFLVDSGAVYSVLRRADWRALGLEARRELDFVLADGTSLTRKVSECEFEIEGARATSPVVLGEREDEAL